MSNWTVFDPQKGQVPDKHTEYWCAIDDGKTRFVQIMKWEYWKMLGHSMFTGYGGEVLIVTHFMAVTPPELPPP
jgi:hypothetical protein